MISHSYAMDAQTKSTELASAVLSAASPPQILSACTAIESFLHKYTPDQTRWFFSITFPTLICKIFGFDESPTQKPPPRATGWIDTISSPSSAAAATDSDLSSKLFDLLSPTGVLMSAISDVDRASLVKYVFPVERLPEWVRFVVQSGRDCEGLADLFPLLKGRLKGGGGGGVGAPFQVQLNVFEYYMLWFAYYPVCKGNVENSDAVRVIRSSKKFRLESWASSIPGFVSAKRCGKEQKSESNLYLRLLYAYLRAFVPLCDLSAHSPYRSSLLQYSSGYNTKVVECAEFLVSTFVHFWLVDNDFSPLPVSVCKSLGVMLPLRSVLGELPPTAGLGEVVNVFVKYLNLSLTGSEGFGQVECTESPRWRGLEFVDIKSRDVFSGMGSGNSWNSNIQRPLYRYILRTFIFCPVETSIKNVSQVFTIWVNYMEPWLISLEDFTELGQSVGVSKKDSGNEVNQAQPRGYSSSWQGFVVANYLFYSSLVMHFIGFAHKFLHTDPEVMVQMVAKVVKILTSYNELVELIRNIDTVFHSIPVGSSKSMLNTLYRFVPSIREQLQDWEDGLSESDADGSFLHENWNKDLQLFSSGEDGGQQLLQLFVLRAESELQGIGGENLSNNLQLLDSLKVQMGCLFGGSITRSPHAMFQGNKRYEKSRGEIFKPRTAGNRPVADVKYKGDWMKRPISDDEVAWLAKLLVNFSGWLNESLGLNQRENGQVLGSSWSYIEVSGDTNNVYEPREAVKLVMITICSWLIAFGRAAVKFMREHGMRVNLRLLASKKVATAMLTILAFGAIKKALSHPIG